jgi:hypothetical protein
MLRINIRTGQYTFFDASPTEGEITAAREKLQIVRRENDHLANLLPDTESAFGTFGNEMRAYLAQQVLMVYGCASEANKHVLLLDGHGIPRMPRASFHALYETGVLPRDVAQPMWKPLRHLRNRIAHPTPPGEVAELYRRAMLMVETTYKYLECIEAHLQTQY